MFFDTVDIYNGELILMNPLLNNNSYIHPEIGDANTKLGLLQSLPYGVLQAGMIFAILTGEDDRTNIQLNAVYQYMDGISERVILHEIRTSNEYPQFITMASNVVILAFKVSGIAIIKNMLGQTNTPLPIREFIPMLPPLSSVNSPMSDKVILSIEKTSSESSKTLENKIMNLAAFAASGQNTTHNGFIFMVHPQQLINPSGFPEPINQMSSDVIDRFRSKLPQWMHAIDLVKNEKLNCLVAMKFRNNSSEKYLALQDFNQDNIGKLPSTKSELSGIISYMFRLLANLFLNQDWMKLREQWESKVFQFNQETLNSVSFFNKVTSEMIHQTGIFFSDLGFLMKSKDVQFGILMDNFAGLYLDGNSLKDYYDIFAMRCIMKINDSISTITNGADASVLDTSKLGGSNKRQKFDSSVVSGKITSPCYMNVMNSINKKIACDRKNCLFDHDKEIFEFPKSLMIKTSKAFLKSDKQDYLTAPDKASLESLIEKSYTAELKGKNADDKNVMRIANSQK